jgi:hypothetical protein
VHTLMLSGMPRGRRRKLAAALCRALPVGFGLVGLLAFTANAAPATSAPVTQTASTKLMSVTFGPAWSVSGESTGSSLLMVGPHGLYALFSSKYVSASESFSDVFKADLAYRRRGAPAATVCKPPESQTLPGTPAVPGRSELLCFPLTVSDGASERYEDLDTVALVEGHGRKLALEVDSLFPIGTSATTIKDDLAPVVFSVEWKQLSTGTPR